LFPLTAAVSSLEPNPIQIPHGLTLMTTRTRHAYRVIVREVAPSQWEWEIVRDDRPLDIRLREGLFKSEPAAMAAGTAALREFLSSWTSKPFGRG
jgi:hypothetical protein